MVQFIVPLYRQQLLLPDSFSSLPIPEDKNQEVFIFVPAKIIGKILPFFFVFFQKSMIHRQTAPHIRPFRLTRRAKMAVSSEEKSQTLC